MKSKNALFDFRVPTLILCVREYKELQEKLDSTYFELD